MQFTTAIAALLLAAPALISAAPVAPSEAVSLITPVEAHDEIFARVVRCVPRKAKDADDQKKIDAALARMRAATAQAHAGEESCKGVGKFNNGTKAEKEKIKKECIAGYTKCVQQRKKAGKECTKAGGNGNDPGHAGAIQVCEDAKTMWSNKKV